LTEGATTVRECRRLQRAGMTYGYDFEDRMTTAGAVSMVYPEVF
jgi:hypothetical protein